MPKVYGYLRVSHRNQSDNTLDTQRRIIEDRFRSLQSEESDMVWGETIADKAQSAFKKGFFQRPGAARLNGMLVKGDVVIFSRVDRAFRNLMDMWKTVEHWKARGVRPIFCDLPLQPGTPFGDMFLSNMGAYAQLDSALKSERIKDGIATKRRMGHIMSSRPPAGFSRVYSHALKRDVLVENAKMGELAAVVIELRESGLGFDRVSDEVEDFLAKRDNRKSFRGIRSRYELKKDSCRSIYERYCGQKIDSNCSNSPS